MERSHLLVKPLRPESPSPVDTITRIAVGQPYPERCHSADLADLAEIARRRSRAPMRKKNKIKKKTIDLVMSRAT